MQKSWGATGDGSCLMQRLGLLTLALLSRQCCERCCIRRAQCAENKMCPRPATARHSLSLYALLGVALPMYVEEVGHYSFGRGPAAGAATGDLVRLPGRIDDFEGVPFAA
jgi:hypothetical protein